MSPTRRDVLKLASALGLAGALPQVVEETPAHSAEATTPTAADGRITTYTMRGFLVIDDGTNRESMHYRELRFTVNHHEYFRDDTVDVVVEHPLRPQDAFDFRVERWQRLSDVLAEIDDYVGEQARRKRQDAA